jgi:O-antigen ligase
MGVAFTILYIIIALLTPEVVAPALAPYRLELIVAILAILPAAVIVISDQAWAIPQTFLWLFVLIGIAMGFLMVGWVGGISEAFAKIMPSVEVFFLVLIYFRSIRRLKILVLLCIAIGCFLTIRGAMAYYVHDLSNPDLSNPMVYIDRNDDGTIVKRLKAFGFLGDPNDLGQYFVTVIPLLWVFWRKKRNFRNFVVVLTPAAILIFGVFLTHSRGALVAVAAVLLFVFKDRIGKTKSAIVTILAFVAVQAADFTAGRSFSLNSGSDPGIGRVALWRDALEALRSAPIFGVGLSQLAEFGRPAHNTYVHAAAELGIFGYFFWMSLIVFGMSDLKSIVRLPRSQKQLQSPDAQGETLSAAEIHSGGTLSGTMAELPLSSTLSGSATMVDASGIDFGRNELVDTQTQSIIDPEVTRFAALLLASLVGFLTAAFFLSRAYTMTLFMQLGAAAALTDVARKQSLAKWHAPEALSRLKLSAGISILSVIVIYVMVRFSFLMG